MHPRIREVVDHLDARRTELRSAVDEVPITLRAIRPAPDRWSVSDVLEHLAIIDGRVAMMFTAKVDAARAGGLAAELDTTPIMPTFDFSILLDRTRAVAAPPQLHPRQDRDPAAAWSALESARAQLRSAVLAADGLALATLSQPHPVLGVLNLYQWIASVGSHEARHTAQIREIASTLAAT
ncbi:MAG: DinB family protein [Gemmatimonadota bacterium]|nr:DinB family protein [Gemmatimonadota bacterium]